MSTTSRVFRIVVLSLAASVLVFVGVGAVLVDRWEVDSSRVISAPPERIEPLLRDFAKWQEWSGMTVELGAGMQREIRGEPGTVGHAVAWSGSEGVAILRLSDIAPGRIDYSFLTERAGEDELVLVARGYIAYREDGAGTRVEWHDEGLMHDLVQRWIGWFGVLQEQVRTIQATSLAGLQRAVEQPAGR